MRVLTSLYGTGTAGVILVSPSTVDISTTKLYMYVQPT